MTCPLQDLAVCAKSGPNLAASNFRLMPHGSPRAASLRPLGRYSTSLGSFTRSRSRVAPHRIDTADEENRIAAERAGSPRVHGSTRGTSGETPSGGACAGDSWPWRSALAYGQTYGTPRVPTAIGARLTLLLARPRASMTHRTILR